MSGCDDVALWLISIGAAAGVINVLLMPILMLMVGERPLWRRRKQAD